MYPVTGCRLSWATGAYCHLLHSRLQSVVNGVTLGPTCVPGYMNPRLGSHANPPVTATAARRYLAGSVKYVSHSLALCLGWIGLRQLAWLSRPPGRTRNGAALSETWSGVIAATPSPIEASQPTMLARFTVSCAWCRLSHCFRSLHLGTEAFAP